MHGEDMVTAPKTPKSVRTIVMPEFLIGEVIDFMKYIPDLRDFDRLVLATKSFLRHEMDRGAKAAGVKRIRISMTYATAICPYSSSSVIHRLP